MENTSDNISDAALDTRLDTSRLCADLNHWYAVAGRPLPWRAPDTSAWGVLVSEIMAQQTPVARVIPHWKKWLERWPTPADLADATTAEVLTAWANLGYPRRALRLREAARGCVSDHGGEVPTTIAELEALPGIGSYTARAVAAFAYGQAVPVVDTNVRRVHRRVVQGRFLAGTARARDLLDVADLLPWVDEDPFLVRRHHRLTDPQPSLRDDANLMCASLMELGALICTARNPQCDTCPIFHHCAWVAAGQPAPTDEEAAAAAKRVQKFEGTDRQCRGRIMALLRKRGEAGAVWGDIDLLWPDKIQLTRAAESLVADGLVEHAGGTWRLPSF